MARRSSSAASWSAGVRPADGVDHEDDDVGLGDRESGLLLDARLDRVVRVDLQAAGVDDHEAPAVPLGVAVQPVARRAGAVLDDRRARADDAVEERALADVRATDDGHDRQRPAEPCRGGRARRLRPRTDVRPRRRSVAR